MRKGKWFHFSHLNFVQGRLQLALFLGKRLHFESQSVDFGPQIGHLSLRKVIFGVCLQDKEERKGRKLLCDPLFLSKQARGKKKTFDHASKGAKETSWHFLRKVFPHSPIFAGISLKSFIPAFIALENGMAASLTFQPPPSGHFSSAEYME